MTLYDSVLRALHTRCRLVLEVVDAVCAQIGSSKVGIRLSPFGGFLNATDAHPYGLIAYLLEELNKRKLAYVHFIEPIIAGNATLDSTKDSITPFRNIYQCVHCSSADTASCFSFHRVPAGARSLLPAATHAPPPWRPSPLATVTWLPLGAPSWPTPTSHGAFNWMRPSINPTRPPFTPQGTKVVGKSVCLW